MTAEGNRRERGDTMPIPNNMPAWPSWETVRLIGRGSFGAVYEIERDVFGETEKAALKVITIPQSSSDIDELYGEGYNDESITNTFRDHLKSIVAEYSLMRKMNGSSNVVNCDDVRYVQHDDGFGWDIFIKMELLTPITKALGKEVTDEQVIRIGGDLCKALILCNKHNIIHRDIKPANIFVSENGDYKLGDFGIAKTVEKTSGGTKIGTYEYMAPEVYRDMPYGHTVDIYSLGMVLYWLLNERRTPFLKMPPELPTSVEKEQARRRRFAGEEIPAPAHGSEEMKRIVLKACAYDPKNRYQNAGEMLQDLEAIGREPKPTPPPTPATPPTPKPIKTGDIITFGLYEQDNNKSNGKEPIEWRVLAKENNGILVISKYALDCQPFNTTNEDTTWEACTLRKWLNGTFLNAAFTLEERTAILKAAVSADKNPEYDTDAGENTQDRVFLLSIKEAETYFTSDTERICHASSYAEAMGVRTDNKSNCSWWLRSPGYRSKYAARVYGGAYIVSNGYISNGGCGVSNLSNGIRPALWIDLDSYSNPNTLAQERG